MPKYVSKKNKPIKHKSEKDSLVTKGSSKSHFNINIPKIQLIVVFLISSAIAIYFINTKVIQLSNFLPVSDETEIIRRIIGGIDETGLPYNIFPKSSPNRKLTVDEVKKKLHYQKNFREEVYMRYAVYKLSDYFNIDWYSFSNLIYFYLFLLIIGINLFIKKQIKLPIITIIFLILLLGLSPWFNSSFHYVRYYFFLMSAQLISFIAAAYIFLNNKNKFRLLFVIIIAYIPTEFHPQGAFNIIFWLFVIIIDEIKKVLTNNNPAHKKRIVLSFTIIIVFLLIFLKFKYGIFQIAWSKLSPENIPSAIWKYTQLNFPQTYLGIFIYILILTGGIFSFKYLSEFEKKLLKYSLIFLLTATFAAASFVGGNYTGFNGINRYFSFAHANYLIIPAIFLSGIIKHIAVKIKPVPIFVPLFIIISLILISINLNTNNDIENYNFSILPYIKKNDVEKIKTELKDLDYEVVCSHQGDASIAFPYKKTYQISNIEKLSEITKEDKYLFFFRVNPGKLSKDLQELYLKIPLFSYNGGLVHTKEIREIMKKYNIENNGKN